MSWSQNGAPTTGPTAGADTFRGGTGADIADGGDGNDSLAGNRGDDALSGAGGADTLTGGDGFDTLTGDGDPTQTGGGDRITDSGEGAVIFGNEGDDTILVTLDGSLAGTPSINGDTGNDSIFLSGDGYEGGTIGILARGARGNDTLSGSEARDTLLGDADNDVITANGGNDSIDAGPGNDLVTWRVGDGSDNVFLGTGTDTLDLEGWTNGANANWTFTAHGNGIDTIFEHIPTGARITARDFESVTCFAEGTRILTARGEVPVEQLRTGDLVVSRGTGVPLKPIRWIGHTRVDIVHHRNKRKVAPIVIRAGALGAATPTRDLRVSPEHAFLLQGRLVPAHLLVNGSTIVQETWHRAMTYWHVELDQHGVLVAEGALAESYFDDGNRHLFDNGVFALHAEFGAQRQGGRYAAEAFAPPVLDADDPALARIRAGLPGAEAAARSA